MSIVIIGGNDRMIAQYKTVCREYDCRAKVFTQMKGELKKQIGSPDFMILFTGTVSHKMVNCARIEARRSKLPVERAHTSSLNALREILDRRCLSCQEAS